MTGSTDPITAIHRAATTGAATTGTAAKDDPAAPGTGRIRQQAKKETAAMRRGASLAGMIVIAYLVAACDQASVTQSQGYLKASQSKTYSHRERD